MGCADICAPPASWLLTLGRDSKDLQLTAGKHLLLSQSVCLQHLVVLGLGFRDLGFRV